MEAWNLMMRVRCDKTRRRRRQHRRHGAVAREELTYLRRATRPRVVQTMVYVLSSYRYCIRRRTAVHSSVHSTGRSNKRPNFLHRTAGTRLQLSSTLITLSRCKISFLCMYATLRVDCSAILQKISSVNVWFSQLVEPMTRKWLSDNNAVGSVVLRGQYFWQIVFLFLKVWKSLKRAQMSRRVFQSPEIPDTFVSLKLTVQLWITFNCPSETNA